jgi:hypothetical protein
MGEPWHHGTGGTIEHEQTIIAAIRWLDDDGQSRCQARRLAATRAEQSWQRAEAHRPGRVAASPAHDRLLRKSPQGAVGTANDAANLIMERKVRRPNYKTDGNERLAHPRVHVIAVRTIHE